MHGVSLKFYGRNSFGNFSILVTNLLLLKLMMVGCEWNFAAENVFGLWMKECRFFMALFYAGLKRGLFTLN